MSNAVKIRRIATKVRKEMESLVKSKAVHFKDANPDLGGWCGFGSVMLYEALNKAGFKPRICSGEGHWFVRCGKYLVDVTASQFGQPKVVVRDYNNIANGISSGYYSRDWWKAFRIDTSIKSSGLQRISGYIKEARLSRIQKNK